MGYHSRVTARSLLMLALTGLLAVVSCSDDLVAPGGLPLQTATPWRATIESYTGSVDALWGQSSTEVYAVGAILARYDGRDWEAIGLPRTRFYPRGGWGAGDDIYLYDFGRIYRRSGPAWDYVSLPSFFDAIWGAPSGEIFVPHRNGDLFRFDGSVWHTDSIQVGNELRGVWGTSAHDVYVAGGRGLVAHYDGIGWTSLSVDTTAYLTMAWRVGFGPLRVRSQASQLYEFDGALARLGPDTDLRVNALYPTGPQAFIAAGRLGNQYPPEGAAYRFDGTTWTSVASTNGEFSSAWAAPTGESFVGGDRGVWRHRDGRTDQILGGTLPLRSIYDFWRTPDGDIIAVGSGAYRYDGEAWIDLKKEVLSGNTAIAVHGRNASDFYAAGSGMVLHYRDGTWTWVGSGFESDINDVWVDTHGVVVVGWGGGGGSIAHYDGSRWTQMESHTVEPLYSIWGWEDGAFAVGGGGVILRYDGKEWRAVSSPVSYRLREVLGFGPQRVIATGDKASEICVYDGKQWKTVATGISDPSAWNTSLWGTSPSDLFMAQDEGMVYHYDGRVWAPLSPPVLSRTYAMVGLPGGDVLVSGDGGILRFHHPSGR